MENLSNGASAQPVGFGGIIKLFFQNYANFKGRSSRREFWMSFLFLLIVYVVAAALTALTVVLGILILLAFVVPVLSLCIRRLHDIGKPWPRILMGLIPIAGAIILIIDYCKESDGDNRWGPGPNRTVSNTAVNFVPPQPAAAPVPMPEPSKAVPVYTPGQPVRMPVQPAAPAAPAVPAAPAPAAPAAPAAPDVPAGPKTDADVEALVNNHAPLDLNAPESKRMMNEAISRLVPTFSGESTLSAAMLQCSPADIKQNIANADVDTLMVALKGLDCHIAGGDNPDVLNLVRGSLMSALKTRV